MPQLVFLSTVVILNNLGSIFLAGLTDIEHFSAKSIDNMFLLPSFFLFDPKFLIWLVSLFSCVDSGSIRVVLNCEIGTIGFTLDVVFSNSTGNEGEGLVITLVGFPDDQ